MNTSEEVHRTTTDPNLRALAATALERLGRAAPRTSELVSVAGGHDSNVALSAGRGNSRRQPPERLVCRDVRPQRVIV